MTHSRQASAEVHGVAEEEKRAGKKTNLTFMQVVATYHKDNKVHFNHCRTLKLQLENMRTFSDVPQAFVKVSQLLFILRKQTWVINNRPGCLSALCHDDKALRGDYQTFVISCNSAEDF